MLSGTDALELPAGVRIDGSVVSDDVRGALFPANVAALFVLARIGRPLGDIAAELAARHDLDPHRARDDVLRFALVLNEALLANVVRADPVARRAACWLLLALRLAPAGSLPRGTARRFPLDTSTPVHAALGALAALRWRAVAVSAAAALLAAPGGVNPRLLGLAAGVGAGLAVHEAGHAALLSGVGGALVVSRLRTFVIHRPLAPGRRRVVALAGPAAAACVGVTMVAVAWLSGLPELAVAGCAPAAHAAGLTVATGDGRAACGL